MAIQQTETGQYTTVLKDTSSNVQITISTNVNNISVTSINIYRKPPENDPTTAYDESNKKALHTAVVNAVKAKFGTAI